MAVDHHREALAKYVEGLSDGRRPPDTEALREAVAGDVARFLAGGGTVEQIPAGQSGYNPMRSRRSVVKTSRRKAVHKQIVSGWPRRRGE